MSLERPDRGEVERGYDRVADEYVRRIADELRHKPLDRELLDRFATLTRPRGRIADVGCGPGHVGRHLMERGVRVCGVDLARGMLERARHLHPGLEVLQGDMTALPVRDHAWAGIVAFYSIIHVPRAEVPWALAEMRRTLEPGGRLLMAFHIGDGALHMDEWWGHRVDIDFLYFQPGEMATALVTAGFTIEEIVEREPYPDVEHPSRRAYLLARRPPSP